MNQLQVAGDVVVLTTGEISRAVIASAGTVLVDNMGNPTEVARAIVQNLRDKRPTPDGFIIVGGNTTGISLADAKVGYFNGGDILYSDDVLLSTRLGWMVDNGLVLDKGRLRGELVDHSGAKFQTDALPASWRKPAHQLAETAIPKIVAWIMTVAPYLLPFSGLVDSAIKTLILTYGLEKYEDYIFDEVKGEIKAKNV